MADFDQSLSSTIGLVSFLLFTWYKTVMSVSQNSVVIKLCEVSDSFAHFRNQSGTPGKLEKTGSAEQMINKYFGMKLKGFYV